MAQDKLEYWREILVEEGIAAMRAQVASMNVHTGVDYISAGNAVIKEYEEKQQDEKDYRRDEREEKTLDLASKAHDRADKSYQQSWIAIGIAGVTAIVTIAIAIAIFKN